MKIAGFWKSSPHLLSVNQTAIYVQKTDLQFITEIVLINKGCHYTFIFIILNFRINLFLLL